jgi:hypothetical protein
MADGGTSLIARAASWYRGIGARRSTSIVALIFANAIPVIGVLFFGWSLMTILVLYWVENGIVGLWTIPRILLARGPEPIQAGVPSAAMSGGCQRLLLVPFFCVHYGIFWLGHGFFLMLLPAFGMFGAAFPPSEFGVSPVGNGLPFEALFDRDAGGGAFGIVDTRAILFAGAAMFVSHGVSFATNYIGRGEYLRTTAVSRMAAVYGRVVVLHLAILFGAFAIAALGAPIWILVILVIGKTLLDLRLHEREHGLGPGARRPT